MDQEKIFQKIEVEVTRLEKLPRWQNLIFMIIAILGIGLSIFYIFGFSYEGRVLLDVEYYWLFIGLFSAAVFLIMPARKADKARLPWYDFVLAGVILGVSFYCFTNARDMSISGWKNIPLGVVIWIIMMEAARRGGGISYLLVVLLIGIFPLFADSFPGIFQGIKYGFPQTIEAHVFRNEGMMGITTKVIAEIILGFLVFAGVLIASGAGDFFIELANALLGQIRGGPAKVAVLSSAFFGSLSGSALSNVAGTGCITIPTMKRIGYPGHYAGAVEACASTGGVIMPPVMGAIAFVMAVTISVDYSVIMVSAIIPSLLYYFGLLMQVDGYAAKVGLRGLPKEEIPSITKVLARGWPYLTVLFFLVWGLLFMRWEYMAPWYAAVLMIPLSYLNKDTRMTPKRLFKTLGQVGELITQTSSIIIPIGFVVSALTITGVTGSVTSGLVTLGGGNIFLVLVFGVAACYVMGMAGLSIVAYIFLSVTLAPAVIKMGGLNVVAVHLFILYYAMLAGITPPVAAASFLGAAIAGAPPMKTALTSMRLEIVIYFVPFFFVFQPSLVLQGDLTPLLYLLPMCVIGIILIAAGCEGYLLKVGPVKNWARIPLVIAGFLFSLPELITTIIGFVAAVVIILALWFQKKREVTRG